MIIAIIKFMIYSILIVLISKYVLVRILRKLSENLNLKPHTIGNITGIATSSSVASLILCASPPESSVDGCPSRI